LSAIHENFTLFKVLGQSFYTWVWSLLQLYLSSFFFLSKGAEWWAQQLGQSIPLFSWVPFVNGKKISDMLFLQFFLQRYFLDFILKFVF